MIMDIFQMQQNALWKLLGPMLYPTLLVVPARILSGKKRFNHPVPVLTDIQSPDWGSSSSPAIVLGECGVPRRTRSSLGMWRKSAGMPSFFGQPPDNCPMCPIPCRE